MLELKLDRRVRPRHALSVAVVAVLAATLACAAASAAPSPAAYRARLSGICRSHTPKLKTVLQRMSSTYGKDSKGYAAALGQWLALGLEQDLQLEAVAVPTSLRPTMAPILRTLRAIDGHVRTAIVDGRSGNGAGLSKEIPKIAKLGTPLNGEFDAAGLRACGSDQSG